MSDLFDSDQQIADAYGLPFLFEGELAKEETDVSIKRVISMHTVVTKWIEKHRRIPSGCAKAPEEERKMSIWLKVVMFYKDMMLDPKDECKAERVSNSKSHIVCQNIIRYDQPEIEEDSL
jgi:hypothetical protein